jgi:hypothetical protein
VGGRGLRRLGVGQVWCVIPSINGATVQRSAALRRWVHRSAVEAARTLWWKEDISDGLTTLWELRRLDLSVEKRLGLKSPG